MPIIRNPFHVIKDYAYRRRLKKELIHLIKNRHPALDRGLQFEGVTHSNPDSRSMTIMLVLQDILREHREFSVTNWPGGIALVRTAQVAEIPDDIRGVNEDTNFIVRGGTDKGAHLVDNAPTPKGADYREDDQLTEASRAQLEENRKKLEEEQRRLDAVR
jgi:hypothetical protein